MVVLMREKGFKSLSQLDDFIKINADKRQSLQEDIRVIESEIDNLSATMEQVHTVKKYRQIYQECKKDTTDKSFYDEYKSQIILYQNALTELKKSYSKLPNSKDILSKLNLLQEKKNTLMQEHSLTKNNMNELYQIRNNFEKYMGKEMER